MTAKNGEVSVVKRANTLPAVQTKRLEHYVSPSTDVYETPDAFVLMVDMPGASREAIKVTMEDGTLSVQAKVSYHSGEPVLLFNELKQTAYYRLFNLGDGVDRNSVDAQYEDGVLLIKLFKNEKAKPREIQIK